MTPLIMASEQGHLEVVQTLLAAGANKEAKDVVGGGATSGTETGCRVHETLSPKFHVRSIALRPSSLQASKGT